MNVALVKPLTKTKNKLDSNILKNYKPVSNLTFLSKVIEKPVKSLQSAYKSGHSTETAPVA